MTDIARRVADLSPEKRRLLLRQLNKKREAQTYIRPQQRDTTVFPLSFAQQRLWFLNQLEPASTAYLIAMARQLRGSLDAVALERSLEELIRRHESLRTTFEVREGQPVQIIHSPERFRLSLVDLRGLPLEGRKRETLKLAGQEAQHPCDLVKGPLLRVSLLRLDVEEHALLLTMHHIISDGWSNEIFERELTILYRAFAAGQASPLPPLPIQYADFAVWQRQWLQGEVLEAQLAYWRQQLAGAPVLDLPTDYPRPPVQTFRGAYLSVRLPAALNEGLLALCQQEEVTLFMLLLAAFQVLLTRYTGQSDISIGTGVANRTRPELEGIIGFFVNTLVLRTDLSGNPPFLEALARVSKVALEAYAHQDVPFEQLVEVLQPERDLSRSPLFQVLFGVQQGEVTGTTQKQDGPRFSDLSTEHKTAKFDLTLTVMSSPHALRCGVEYNTDIFAPETIQRLLGHWQILLEGIVAAPQTPLINLPIITSAERDLLLRDWNNTFVSVPIDQCIHTVIVAQAQRIPDAIAVIHEDQQLSYAALDQRANQLAHYLQNLGVGPEVLVGICMERSVALVVGLLGILKAGGAYVPFDSASPRERLSAMLEDIQVSLLLTEERLRTQMPQQVPPIMCLDTDWKHIAQESIAHPDCNVSPANLAYVICTSGSTGRPKGVLVTHKNVVHSTLVRFISYREPVSSYLLLSPVTFDSSIVGLFWTLCQGGTLVLPREYFQYDLSQLPFVIAQYHISHMLSIPSLYAFILTKAQPEQLADLRTVIVAGEACPDSLVRRHREVLPETAFYNEYGPTEGTVWCSVYQDQGQEPLAQVPIGQPIPNMQIYLLDRFLQPVPIGAIGELCIGGLGVVRGYLNHAEMTAEKFLPHPFSDKQGERLYRTGDRARYRSDGNIEFLGRIDQQIKLRGYRIELGEIEAVLDQHPVVQESVVLAQEEGASFKKLVAYVVPGRQDGEVDEQNANAVEHVSLFQSLYDQLYAQKEAFSGQDAAINKNVWTSSYTNQSLPEEEVLESVDDTVQRVLALQPDRVLEIGCGTGLLLFRIAPHCSHYCGIDLSDAALNRLHYLASLQEPKLTNLSLYHGAAHGVANIGFETGAFDTVIINEVVQHFPDIDYLQRVLESLVAIVKPGGTVFIGGLRSHSLLKTFHTSVQLYQASASLPVAQLQQRIREHQFAEKDLVIDPAFFVTLQQRIPQISLAHIQLKGGHRHNEITRFKYDVFLQVGGDIDAGPVDFQWLNWQEQGLTVADIRTYLLETEPAMLGIKGIPNARLLTDVRTVELLAKEQEDIKTVADVREALQKCSLEMSIDPEDLWMLGQDLPYLVNIRWSLSSADGSLNVTFKHKKPQDNCKATLAFLPEEVAYLKLRHTHANNPSKGKAFHNTGTQLRHYLQGKLPEYMVPARYIVLEELPRTPHGKVDRRALAALNTIDSAVDETFVAARTPIEELITEIWRECLGQQQIGIYDNFFTLGGHSLLATQVASRMRTLLQVELPLRSLFEAPTIAQLALQIEQALRGVQQPELPPLVAVDRRQTLPLSFAQQRLWFLDQLDPGSTAYLMPGFQRLSGPLDTGALLCSLHALVQRHESLRTTFQVYAGQPIQVIHPAGRFSLPLIDLQNLEHEEREGEMQRLVRQERQQPCDLANGPLLRTHLLRSGEQDHVFLVTMHHIISDGWSQEIFERELVTLYQAFATGQPSPLSPLPIQYVDFALWQRQWLQGEILETQLAYWHHHLSGASTLELSTDHPRPPIQTYQGALQSVRFPEKLRQELVALSQRENVTLFMLLLATFQVLLARYSGQSDISVGTPIANRTRAEVEGLIGFFVNTLVLRTDLSGNPSFVEVLRRVREVALGAYTHQDVPFEQLVEELQPERDLSRSPLFQVMFTLQQVSASPQKRQEALRLSRVNIEHTTTKFDLSLFVTLSEAELYCGMEYSTDLFEAETIQRLLEHWQLLLQGIASAPHSRLSKLELLSQSQRQQLLQHWQGPRLPGAAQTNLIDLFEAQMQRTPHSVALVWQEQHLSYQALYQLAVSLSWQLRQVGVGPEVLVGVCLQRSPLLLIAIVAVLLAGGAYLPLEPGSPLRRIQSILQEAQVAVLLTQAQVRAQLATVPTNVLELDEWLSQASSWLGQAPAQAPSRAKGHTENLAYVLYTSGSTGQPKGVALTHRSALVLMQWAKQAYSASQLSAVLAATSVGFDLSIFEMFVPLSWGGCLVLVPSALQLGEQAADDRVSLINTVPSVLAHLLRQGQLPQGVQVINLAGEALGRSLVQTIYEQAPGVQVYNLYGPTEDTTYSTGVLLADEPLALVPLGQPLPNTQLYLLDSRGQLVPPGVPGELYLAGSGLARGYLSHPDWTAERFLPNAFSDQPGARLYRTGDRARWHPDGQLEYLGRMDHQIKLHGLRIELGEIEAALTGHPAVESAVVVPGSTADKRQCLIAYVLSRQAQTPVSEQALRSYLHERLPDYMVPTFFVTLDTLPLTPNGKIDRRALPAPQLQQEGENRQQLAPRTSSEDLLVKVWSEVLGRSQIGIHDNFFALGGDSILSIQVIARAKQAGLQLTPRQLFQYQTIAQLAIVAETSQASSTEQALVMGPVPLTPIQHWFFAQELPERHHYNQAMFLEMRERLHPSWLQQAIWHLLRQHDALRLRFVRDASSWSQFYAALSADIPFVYVDLSRLAETQQFHSMEALATVAQKSLGLANGPMLRSIFFDCGAQQVGRLLLIIHHLVVDGVSWRILLADLESILSQISRGEEVQLPARTTSFQHWAQELLQYAQSDALQQELSYWMAPARSEIASLPVDLPDGTNTIASSRTIRVALSVEQTRALLQEVPSVYHTQINDVLLAGLAQAFAAWTGQRKLLVDLEGHGREEILDGIDLSRTVGWFTTIFPVVLDIEQATKPGETLKTVKEQLRQVPQRGIGYGLLRYLHANSGLRDSLASLPQAQVIFNYLGQFDPFSNELSQSRQSHAPAELAQRTHRTHGSTSPAYSHQGQRSHQLEITGWIGQGQLQVVWQFSQQFHLPETIRRLAHSFLDALQEIIDHCQSPDAGGYTPSDFPLALLNQSLLDQIRQQIQQAGQQIEDIYPLSPMQAGLLFHSLYAPEAAIYCGQFGWMMRGAFNVEAWQRAWQQVINRHTALRTLFLWQGLEQPLQIVCRHVEVPLAFYDWRELSPQEQRAQLEVLYQQDRERGFDLARAPLLRLTLLRLSEDTFYFLHSQHHLLLDGWSQPLLFREVQACYQAYCQGREPVLASPRPYRDYIAWLQQQEVSHTEQFWRRYLTGFTIPTILAVDRQPHAGRESSSDEMALAQLHLSKTTTSSLQRLAQHHLLTMNTIMQGVWALLLAHYSGEEDVVFGATVAGRPAELAGVESMIGIFINTLPVRVHIEPEMPLITWLSHLQAQQAEARQYEYTPLVEIQRWSEVPVDQPLFESLLLFQNYPMEPLERASSESTAGRKQASRLALHAERSVEHTNYPLCLTAAVAGDALHLELSYDRVRFDTITIKRMLQHVQTLLEAMTSQQQRLVDLPLLTEAERDLVLERWNAASVNLPQDLCLHHLFEKQVACTEDAIAIVYEDEQLTYGALNQRANQLAHYLQELNVEPEMLAGVCMERSVEAVVALLGILKAGAAYVPLDPSAPGERLALILEDIQMPVLLTQERLAAQLPSHATSIVCLDREWRSIAEKDASPPRRRALPANLAYVIYTSGSTGRPKGVAITHANIVHSTLVRLSYFEEPVSSFLLLSPLFFDSAMAGLYWTLCQGGKLVLPQEDFRYDLTRLPPLIAHYDITHMLSIPSLYTFVLSHAHLEHLQSLRVAIVAGEACPASLVHLHREMLPEVAFYNEYGPTEGTVWCSVYRDQGQEPLMRVSIGRPIANMQIYLLDRFLRPVPIGVPGELYIGGSGVARGYLNHAALTAEKFLPHPLAKKPGERLYRTGDLARYSSNGELEFLGRVDHQVKLRGYRIELGEIEDVLKRHPHVWDGAVVLWEDAPGEACLVGYVAAREQPAATSEQLRDFAQQYLPEYMVPSLFVFLDSLPLTANGKVDRRQLPRPEQSPEVASSAPVAAYRPIEEILLDIWKDVLSVPSLDLHSNFFALGGHSLLVTQLVARLRTVLQVDLPVRSLFEAPTIAQLAQRVEQALRGARQPELPPLGAVERNRKLPLSFAQQRLWFLEQLEPENAAYLITSVQRLQGPLDTLALEHSLQELLQRHESLRTIFRVYDEQPVQVILPPAKFRLPVLDLQRLEQGERIREARRLAEQEAQHPCDLARGPLWRAYLLRLASQEHVLQVTMHHIISDGWSQEVFERELALLYRAFAARLPSPLPPLPIQYADFALWQRQWLQGVALQGQLDYWQQQLKDAPPLELPTDHPRPPVKTYRGAFQSLQLPATLRQRLVDLSQQESVTLFMLLLAAFQVLLARYSGQSDISVGTAIANRTRSELEGLIGFFVNTLVLRTDLSDNPSFVEVLRRVREVALGAYAHQDVPFEQLVEVLQPERDLSRSPLFQVMFNLQQLTGTAEELPQERQGEHLNLSGLSIEYSLTKFDLTLTVINSPQGLHCSVGYSTDLFEASTINQWLEHWLMILEEIVVHPLRRILDLPLLTASERQQLLLDWNDTAVAYPGDLPLHELFEAQVERTPDAIALVFEFKQLTYRDLNQRTNQLAHHLRSRGIGLEARVGICIERSLDMIVAVLGVLKAGGAYIPLDPASPVERLAFMLRDAEVGLIITQEHLAERLLKQMGPLVCLDSDWQAMRQESEENPDSFVHPINAAYILYTSGSTGNPKGVLVEHKQIVNYIRAVTERVAFTTPASFAMVQPLTVDSCLTMLFPALLTGGVLHVISQERVLDPAALADYFSLHPVDYLKIAPSHLAALLTEASPRSILPQGSLIIGGEASQWEWFQHLCSLLPEGSVYNHYGPTETTVGSLMFQMEAGIPGQPGGVLTPIGKPLANTRLYVLDTRLLTVPPGVIGELHISGAGLARGYSGRPDVTAEHFIPNPFSSEAGARLYKTGDLVRYRQDGNIEFVGRRDEQVKIRGYRIEPGEIEAALLQHPTIREVIVLAAGEPADAKRLVAAAVAQEGMLASTQEIQHFLRAKLPEYMIPSVLVWVETLPLIPHGKVDRRALLALVQAETKLNESTETPRSSIEEVVMEIWKQVLGCDQVGIHENFFETGGHSLLAVQLIARLRAVLQVDLPVRTLFEAPSIAQLAQQINQALGAGQTVTRPPLLPAPRTGPLPLSFAQRRLWFLDQVEPGNCAYLIHTMRRLPEELEVAVLERSLQEMVQRHESLRTTFAAQEGQPVQVIHPAGAHHLPVIDLSGLERVPRRHEVRRLSEQEAGQPCDLTRGPLLRSRLLRLAEQEHRLFITLHHIIADGWSMQVFYRELRQLYQVFASGQLSPLPPLPIQYADFALWQRQCLQGELLDAQLDYWRRQLSGASPLKLPLDHPRPSRQHHRGMVHSFQLSPELTQGLVELSQREGLTLFMTLLAAFQVLLYRYSSQEDIVVGTDSANRDQLETEGLIGFFINLLALRTNLSGQPSFRELLKRVRTMVLGAYSHQETPFELVVEKLMPAQRREQMMLVQALFVLQNLPLMVQQGEAVRQAQGPEAIITANPGIDEEQAAKFDLAVFLQERAGGMQGAAVYRRELFEPETITTMMERFIVLLQSTVSHPDYLINQLDFFTEAERMQQAREEHAMRGKLRIRKGERVDLPRIDLV